MPDSLEILQAVIDSYDQPVFALDRELRYIAFNRMAADGMRAIYGAEITLGGRLTDYQTETADRRSALTNLTKALAGERIVAGGYSGEKGRRRYYDFTHIPLTDAGGEVYGVVVRADDLTEQRAATSGLQASEERLHRSLAAAKAGTWEWDTASGANTWSEELWELYDLERDGREPSYDLWLESIHPDDRHAAATRVADAAAAGDEVDTEWRVNTRDGSLRWLVSRGSPVRDADDTVVRYLGVVMDITRRKEAEMALHRSRGELRALVDSFPDIVFQIDRDRRLVVANAPFEQAIVTSGGAPIAPGDPILPPDYPEEFRALWRGHYDRAFGGESFAVETTVPMTDGAHLMESHLTPVRSDGDEVTGVVITSRDITERRRAEQELRDSEARFRAYFEQSLIGAAVTSPAMAWIDVNEATCDLLGLQSRGTAEAHLAGPHPPRGPGRGPGAVRPHPGRRDRRVPPSEALPAQGRRRRLGGPECALSSRGGRQRGLPPVPARRHHRAQTDRGRADGDARPTRSRAARVRGRDVGLARRLR